MLLRHRSMGIVLGPWLLSAVGGCGSPSAPGADAGGPSDGAEQNAPDIGDGPDETDAPVFDAGDAMDALDGATTDAAGADTVDPCLGVTCSGHGACVLRAGTAACSCNAGFHSAGIECLADSALAGQVFLEWSRPTTNADGTALRDLRSHRIYVGTARGVYDRVIDLFTDTAWPGMIEQVVTSLTGGTRYYFAVIAVDAEGNESALSVETSAVAYDPAPEVEPVWDGVITTLPYTIAAGGNYRLGASVVQGAGDAIGILADGVNLYGGNGFYGDGADTATLIYSETGAGNAVVLGRAVANVNVYGFHFVRGAAVHTNLAGSSAVYAPSGFGPGGQVHHNTFDLTRSYARGVVSNDFDGTRIFGNAVSLRNGSVDLTFVSGSSSSSFKVYGNTVDQSATTGYAGAFQFVSNGEFYQNTVTLGADVDQGFFAQGWGDGNNYFHDNDIVTFANKCRPFNPDGGGAEWLILHNRITMGYAGPSADTSRGISMRYGSNHHMIGYNFIDASAGRNSRPIRFGGNDPGPGGGPEPHDVWVYHNTFRSEDAALEFYGVGNGFYSWNNVYDGTSAWAILMGDAAGNSRVYFDHDRALSSAGRPVSKPATYSVEWTACDSFGPADVSGDTIGISFTGAPCPYPVADVPSPPTAVVAR